MAARKCGGVVCNGQSCDIGANMDICFWVVKLCGEKLTVVVVGLDEVALGDGFLTERKREPVP